MTLFHIRRRVIPRPSGSPFPAGRGSSASTFCGAPGTHQDEPWDGATDTWTDADGVSHVPCPPCREKALAFRHARAGSHREADAVPAAIGRLNGGER
jgi:hypothetical protein